MSTHPIEGLMRVAMENIKEMVDVNTIVGDAVETPDGSVIMPISKVGFGFAAGGSEFVTQSDGSSLTKHDGMNAQVAMPFGGGSGGGVSITPIAFLVVSSSGVKVVPLDNQTHIYERLIDSAPQVVEKIQNMLNGMGIGNSSSTASGTATGTMSGSMPVSAPPTTVTANPTGSTMPGSSATVSTGTSKTQTSNPATPGSNPNFIV